MVNSTRRLPKHAATMHGLHKWHKSLFEKLGWMVLAKAKGYTSKLVEYKKSIDHFLSTAKHVMREYESKNRKHDLNVLIMNMEVLKEHAMHDF